MQGGSTFVGTRVLVVEDEYYIADDLCRALESAGVEVVGPASTLAKASELLDSAEFELAILDLNLHGESALPLAERLMEQGKSFAFATGYGAAGVPDRFQDVPRVEKPFDPRALLELVSALRGARK